MEDEEQTKKAPANRTGLIIGIVVLVIGIIVIIVLIVLSERRLCTMDGNVFQNAVQRLVETTRRYPNELIQVNEDQAANIIRQIRSITFKNMPNCSGLADQVEQFATLCAPSGYRQLCGQPAPQQPQFDPGCNIILEIPPRGVNGTACSIIQQNPVFN